VIASEQSQQDLLVGCRVRLHAHGHCARRSAPAFPLQERKGIVRSSCDRHRDRRDHCDRQARERGSVQHRPDRSRQRGRGAVSLPASAGSWATASTTDAGKANIMQEVNSLILHAEPIDTSTIYSRPLRCVMAPQKYDVLASTPRSSVERHHVARVPARCTILGVTFDKWHRLTGGRRGRQGSHCSRTPSRPKCSRASSRNSSSTLPPQIKNFETFDSVSRPVRVA
jgi:hypothetical protein